ncbi:hypothetical protein [Trinickia mobilis]|uniref:hypothetical protein n=1 Tax=Trinickia mobilis TaxID=2816356 RepID=UPI001A8FFF58|nr:hypothetical protein [Trinickia mobilis]
MASLGGIAGDDAVMSLQTWLSALTQCETLMGEGEGDRAATGEIELLRMTLAACKADIVSLMAEASEGDGTSMAGQEVLLAFLRAEVASLTSRIKSVASVKRRVRVRLESK